MHPAPRPSLNSPAWRIVRWDRRRVWLFFRVDVPIAELVEPFRVETTLNGHGRLSLTVPAGFETDFASIPPELWPILPPIGRWGLAAIAHDFLYGLPGVSRFLADAIFRELMAWSDVGLCDRLAIFYAVRFFGWIFRRPRPPRKEPAAP